MGRLLWNSATTGTSVFVQAELQDSIRMVVVLRGSPSENRRSAFTCESREHAASTGQDLGALKIILQNGAGVLSS